MGKYRLQSRNKNSMITLMEVDTECRAWYIKADDRNAAIRALRDMGKEILPVESIYINGEDVSDEVFSSIAIHMGALWIRDRQSPCLPARLVWTVFPFPMKNPWKIMRSLLMMCPCLPWMIFLQKQRRCRRKQKVCRKWICLTYFQT